MSHLYTGAPPSRKGITLLRRLGVRLRWESTIEERTLLLLDACPEVVKVERSEPVAVHLPDGTEFSYTPDYDVTLQDGQQYTLDCKPAQILKPLLQTKEDRWQAKDGRLTGLGRPLRIVTERDCPRTWLEQVKTFSPFHDVEAQAEVHAQCITVLRERGIMLLLDLRDYLKTVLPEYMEAVDSTVYGMLARAELISDVQASWLKCRVCLPGGGLPRPPAPLGRMYKNVRVLVKAAAPSETEEDVPGPPAWQYDYEQSERGQKYRTLYSLYSDPSVPLSEDQARRLGRKVGLSTRSVYRFRGALRTAGAPGITFADVVPHISASGHGRPRRQISPQVQAIIERKVKEHYFLPPGHGGRIASIAALHEEIEKAALAEELLPPSPNTVKRYVAIIEQRNPVEAARLRHGREAAQKLEARQGHLEVSRYGELIAIDCSPCDVFVLDDEVKFARRSGRGKGQGQGGGKPYRPNMVTVVDVATSQVLRVVVFPRAVRAVDILRVLRELFLGETSRLRAAGVTVLPQARGLPTAIRMDAGREFVNFHVQRVLEALGIQVLPRAKWNRHFGGVEERTIQVFTHAHHTLPGTSMNSIERRGEHDTQKLATLSIRDVDDYNQKMLERHNSLVRPPAALTRQQHAQDLEERGLWVWRPLSAAQLNYLNTRMYPETRCLCGAEGVKLWALTYTAASLESLIHARRSVLVSFDPDDVSKAHVIHPDTGARLEVKARLPEGLEGPLSLDEWEEIKRTYRTAEQAAKRRVKTPAQIAAEVMQGQQERQQQNRKELKGRARVVKSLKPRIEETDAQSTIEPAPIAFEEHSWKA